MPGRGKRSGFGFAITHNRGDNQFRIVESGAACMRESVAEFPAFVNRSGSFRRAVTADAAWKRELPKELAQALRLLALLRIDFGVRAFQIRGPENSGSAVAGPSQERSCQGRTS